MNLQAVLENHKKWLNGNGGEQANLSDADLSDADLSDADLRRADLRWADLSGAKGLLSAKDFLSQFGRTEDGAIVCYKIFGKEYHVPNYWHIKPGSFISEVCNPNRADDCGCGVNVATARWISEIYRLNDDDRIWECNILPEDFFGIIVPYNTNGKFRAERVKLVRQVTMRDALVAESGVRNNA